MPFMPVRTWIAALALTAAITFAQTKPNHGVEVPMILTVADHVRHHPPSLKRDGVTIVDATITDWIPLESGHDLELFVLIDDAANYDLGSKLRELGRFVISQPAAVSVGVAYIHDGNLKIVENPTPDRSRVARALRALSGGKTANPYCVLSDLIQRWQRRSLRREIVLVSTGIAETATEAGVCVDEAIHDAERAGIVVYAFYNPAADYLSEKRSQASRVDSGAVDLVCYETGGEAFFLSHDPSESINPFLADIAEHLEHQYLVKFRISPGPESGFQPISVRSGFPSLELMAPESVWVPKATRQH
jgi:hypothetical protein